MHIDIIGDLHGSLDAYHYNLRELGYLNTLESTWPDQFIFMGDILGDRHSEGMLILQSLRRLRNQMNSEKKDITVLAGNHDYFFLSFLLNQPAPGMQGMPQYTKVSNPVYFEIFQGLMECFDFLTSKLTRPYPKLNHNYLKQLNQTHHDILNAIRLTRNGKELISDLLHFKLVYRWENTLFTHTDFTSEMCKFVLDDGIELINRTYKDGLKQFFYQDKRPNQKWFELVETFLNSFNREYLELKWAQELSKIGVYQVIHGHSDLKNERISHVDLLKLFSVDYSAGKYYKSHTYFGQRSASVARIQNNRFYAGKGLKLIKNFLV